MDIVAALPFGLLLKNLIIMDLLWISHLLSHSKKNLEIILTILF